MMGLDDLAHVGVACARFVVQAQALSDVVAHLALLVIGQGLGALKHFLRDHDLADVQQQAAGRKIVQGFIGQAEVATECRHQYAAIHRMAVGITVVLAHGLEPEVGIGIAQHALDQRGDRLVHIRFAKLVAGTQAVHDLRGCLACFLHRFARTR